MKEYLLVLIVLSIASYAYLKLAIKFKIIDKPNSRSSHTKITVRGGGIIFTIGVLLFFLFNDFQYPYFLIGTLLIATVSFIDDIKTLSSKLRLLFQFLAIGFLFYEVGIEALPLWSVIPFAILGVSLLNGYNFMDGINGITSLYSLVTVITFYYLNIQYSIIPSELLIYIIISIVVFCFYNLRKKAIMFAGDVGALTLAMLVFFVGVKMMVFTKSPLIILLLSVYGVDGFFTVVYRFYKKEKLTDPHRHHIYQKLVDRFKMPHLTVSFYYAFLQLLVNIVVVSSLNLSVSLQYMVGVITLAIIALLYILLFRKLNSKTL